MSPSEFEVAERLGAASRQKIAYLESVLGVPFTYGNRIRVLQNGDEIFPAMLKAVADARFSVNFATYVYWTGDIAVKFADLLSRKAKEGVTVRVLIDAVGGGRMRKSLLDQMREAGVNLRWFRPFRRRFWDFDKRTHRKLLICDQTVGFTGGVGIASEWEGDARDSSEWRETHCQFWGECVRFLDGAFWDDWFEVDPASLASAYFAAEVEGGARGRAHGKDAAVQVLSSSPSSHQSVMERAFVAMVRCAERRIRVVTPYFVIQDRFAQLLLDRAAEGVSIEVMVPGERIDRRFETWMRYEHLPDLLDGGITFYRYRPTMLHSKLWLLDDELACVGSPNLNQRSRKKDDEVAVVLANHAIVKRLDEAFDRDLEVCERVGQRHLRRAGRLKRLMANLLSPVKEQL